MPCLCISDFFSHLSSMVHKCFLSLKLLLLFLGFSFVVSSLAVPTTRSLRSTQVQDSMEWNMGEEGVVDLGEGYINGRMDLENTDYPGTGANNHHDPKTPGRP